MQLKNHLVTKRLHRLEFFAVIPNNQRLFPSQELYNTQEEFKNKPLNVGALLPVFILKMNSAEEISTEKSHDAYKEQR